MDTNDTDFNVVEKVGGTKTISQRTSPVSCGLQANGLYLGEPVLISDSGKYNNLQPYFTCYIWCRIA